MIDSVKIKKIKLIITDVDGVLTDGTFLQGASNIEMKRFCVQDGTAVAMAKTAGLKLAVISGRFSNATEARMKELKIMDVYNGTLNKLIPYEELKKKYNISDDQIAYIGDDLIDIPVMEKAGFSVAVQNAYPDVKKIADYVTDSKGGKGAFRELIDLLLNKMGIYDTCLEKMKDKIKNNS